MAVNKKKDSTKKAPKIILIGILRSWEWFLVDLIVNLRKKYNCSFVFLVPLDSSKNEYQLWCKGNDKVISLESVEGYKENNNKGDDLYKIALKHENNFNMLYFRDIIQPLRNLATSFLGYAPYNPKSYLLTPDIEDITKKINNSFAFFEDFLRTNKIDLIIKRPDKALGGNCLDYIALKKSIPSTFPANARFKSLACWSFGSLFFDKILLEKEWKKMPRSNIRKDDIVNKPAIAGNNKLIFENSRSIKGMIKGLIKALFTYLDFLQNDIRKGIKAERPPLFRNLMYVVRIFKISNKLNKYINKSKNKIYEKPFLLYLLQLEPELGTNTQAREFNHTAAIIQQLSLSLPSGYNLLIKENVSILGGRRTSFYDDIERLPNTYLVDPSIPGQEIIAKSNGVITLTGSAPIEAARYGISSIVFSINTEYAFLPSVHEVKSLLDLPDIIKEVIRIKTKKEKDIIKEAGWRYVDSLKNTSIDASGTKWFSGNKNFSNGQITELTNLLIKNWSEQKILLFKVRN